MNEVVVLSGKGGTGKTSVTASFAALAKDAVLADADVDAANLSLVLGTDRESAEPFTAGEIAVRDFDICTGCGLCLDTCRFDAIGEGLRIDPHACEGCGLCARLCPEEAISMRPRPGGSVTTASTPYGPLVSGRLNPGGENSGKLATLVKHRAREAAKERGAAWLIVDGPPGVGCPAIASLTGADLALVVTEPGVAGEHDLSRILALARHFRVPVAVVINKADLHPEGATRIRESCAELGVRVLGAVPFDRNVVQSIVEGRPPVLATEGAAAGAHRALWKATVEEVSPTRRERR